MKVLYVENNHSFIAAVKREFFRGFEVRVESTIKGAMSAFESENFDLVLCDFDLDDGKGRVVVESIRKIDHEIPIIAVSSHAKGNDELLKAGANLQCPKMEFGRINAVIREVMK